MITQEEIAKIASIREAVSNNSAASQDDVNYLIQTKREASKIRDECIAVLEMIRRR